MNTERENNQLPNTDTNPVEPNLDETVDEVLDDLATQPAEPAVAEPPAEDAVAETEEPVEDAAEQGDAQPEEDTAPSATPKDMSLVYAVSSERESEAEEAVVPAKYSRRAMHKIGEKLGKIFPTKRDSGREKVRKSVFLVAIVSLLSSICYLVYDMVYVPFMNEQTYNSVSDLYNPDAPVDVPIEYQGVEFPSGMTNVLKAMYAQNNDLRGYLIFESDDGSNQLDIEYPVMWSGDNEYYLDHDFYKKKNSNGALFFDEQNWVDTFRNNLRSTIVYGHNNINGQMFSDVISLTTNLDKARNATSIALETLYGHEVYRVFAIAMFDEDAEEKYYFDYRQKVFSGDAEFLDFIEQVRTRSYWNYDAVDIRPDDQLLVLSTCTTENTSKLKNGRIAVFARLLRSHESYETDENAITANKDVIMPYAWYVNHHLQVPDFYTSKLFGGTTGTTTTTSGSDTSSSGESTTTTTTTATPST